MNLKKLSKIFAIFLCLTSLVSCANLFSTETQTLPEDGTYKLINENGVEITEESNFVLKNGVFDGMIKLNNNGTFISLFAFKSGTWKLSDNLLYVKSNDNTFSFIFEKVDTPPHL